MPANTQKKSKVANIQGSYERGEAGQFRLGGYHISQHKQAAILTSPTGIVTRLHMKAYDNGTVDDGGVGYFEVENIGKGNALPLTIRFSNGTTLVRVSHA
jgi:hypothetical protein